MHDIRILSQGRWPEILTKLGADGSLLDGKHRPCPACGGKDRFRFDNKEDRGSHICSQCGAGDGFELVRKMFDYSGFKDAAYAVEGVLGIDCEPPTREAREAYRRKLEAERTSREKLDAETHRLAAIEAQRIWAGSKPAGNDHPYLQAKQVQPYGIRIDNGSLIIPVRIGDRISGIQRIGADGSKRFLKDGEIIGGYHSIAGADPADMSRIYICEGYATGATVREATGGHVAVAFNAGNLGKVAQAIRSKLPDIQIIIAGDNDSLKQNTGETKGKAAAESVGGIFTMPPEPGDWNDYAAAHGMDAVRGEIARQTTCEKCEKTPEPIPLAQVSHPEPLVLRLMPDCLADIVGNVADATQAPRELAWGVAMAVLATAIGRRAKVELPTHKEPSPLWTCCILPPGSRKSGVFQALTKPLADIEAEFVETWEEDWLRWKAEAELAEASIQHIKQEAKKKGADRKTLALELTEEKRALEAEPVKPCLYLTDTTTEALRKALQEHGSVGLLSAEGSSIVESFGRYNGGNKGADMALFLAAHAGDPDKGGRVSGTHGVREALASMGITAQPDVLQTIGRDRMARGRGMVDRFLFLIPQDPRGSRTYRNQPKLSPVIENKWAKIIRRIIQVETQETIPCAGVDEDAADAWLDFAQDIEDRQAQGGDLRAMAGFASKLAGAVGRIALAYHFAQGRNADSSIDTATMLQAIGTGIAMIDHARAAMQMMGEDETTARARLVAEGIARHGLKSVKPWEIASKHLGGCKTAEEARTACHKLAEHGYLIAIEQATDKQGRKPKDAYSVHPALFSHFSHFSQAEDSGSSGKRILSGLMH